MNRRTEIKSEPANLETTLVRMHNVANNLQTMGFNKLSLNSHNGLSTTLQDGNTIARGDFGLRGADILQTVLEGFNTYKIDGKFKFRKPAQILSGYTCKDTHPDGNYYAEVSVGLHLPFHVEWFNFLHKMFTKDEDHSFYCNVDLKLNKKNIDRSEIRIYERTIKQINRSFTYDLLHPLTIAGKETTNSKVNENQEEQKYFSPDPWDVDFPDYKEALR